MAELDKLYYSIMSGTHDKNIKFRDLQRILDALGFDHRIRGDHFIYYFGGIRDNINIQPNKNMAKPYQVKQVRDYLLAHKIVLPEE